MKVIFLDIDGVLNRLGEVYHGEEPVERFEPECVAALNRILEQTGAVLVLSSDWRHLYYEDQLDIFLRRWGVDAQLMGCTDDLRGPDDEVLYGSMAGRLRGAEVKAWVDGELGRIERYLAIDDLDLRGEVPQLLTDPEDGLTEEDADAVIAYLEGDDDAL